MAKLPHDARTAWVSARSTFTPSAERLTRLHGRIQQAVLSGATPSVPEEVTTHQRFVGLEQAQPWYRGMGAMALGVVALTVFTLVFVVFSRPHMSTPELPGSSPNRAGSVERAAVETAAVDSPSREPAAPEPSAGAITRPSPSLTPRANPASSEITQSRPKPAQGATPLRTRVTKPAPRSEDPFGPAFDPPEPKRELAVASSAAPATSSGGRSPQGEDRLSREVHLIARARQALDAGQPERAEEALREHRDSFPAGQLVGERIALQVRARCMLNDRLGAKRSFEELLLRSPKSSLRRAVERTCGELLSP